ncbi:unnamed protein product [Discula destructiva]
MNNHDDIPDEPPPSYQEATGNPSHTFRPESQPPPLPPRQPSKRQQQPPHLSASTSHSSISPPSPSPSPSTHQPAQTFSQLLPTVNRQFPPTINLYRDALPGGPLQRRLFLGEHQYPPLYAVGVWVGAVVLHNGPSDDFPPLATVAFQDPLGSRMAVSLPPTGAPDIIPPQPVHATLSRGGTLSFSVEVPWAGEGCRREAFEWRRTRNSAAVGALGGATQGWKLVRLANELPPGGGAGRGTGAGTGPPSGDGHEVVAVCASAVMSLTKLWKFCFLGTGVSGLLGERWAVMAVSTGLVTWDRDNRV